MTEYRKGRASLAGLVIVTVAIRNDALQRDDLHDLVMDAAKLAYDEARTIHLGTIYVGDAAEIDE